MPPAGVTGLLVTFYGLAGVLFPETASSAGTVWGIAAIAWGVAFLATAAVHRDRETASPYGDGHSLASLARVFENLR